MEVLKGAEEGGKGTDLTEREGEVTVLRKDGRGNVSWQVKKIGSRPRNQSAQHADCLIKSQLRKIDSHALAAFAIRGAGKRVC